MPTLNDMMKDLPTHKNFYLRGVFNSLLPEFMNPFDSSISEDNVSGEALEALRIAVTKIHPDLQDGEIASINYEQMMDAFGDTSIFERNYNIETVGDELRSSLGQFGVTKENGEYVVFDTYDFEPRGGIDAAIESIKEFKNTGSPYPLARYIGGVLMPEGPGGEAAEDALRIRIRIPNEPQVVDMDFDNDIEPTASTFVFEGPMTNKRKKLWDTFTSMFITPAEAAGLMSSNDNLDPRLTRDLSTLRVLQLKGKDPFPMDGNDEYGRMNAAQRAIADEGSIFDE